MKPFFLPRFLAFTLSFWAGTLVAVFLLVTLRTALAYYTHFWSWLLSGIRYDLVPVALDEIIRSPIMGLLAALICKRDRSLWAMARFGAVCGAASYAVADAVKYAGLFPWSLAPWFRQIPTGDVILVLPVGMILVDALWKRKW